MIKKIDGKKIQIIYVFDLKMDNIRIEKLCRELEDLVSEIRDMRLEINKSKNGKSVKLPPVKIKGDFMLQTPFSSAMMIAFGGNPHLNEIDEFSLIIFLEKVQKFLSHLQSNYPTFLHEFVFREVLRLIRQVCPTQQLIFQSFIEMSAPSVEDALKCLSVLQMSSSEQRSYLRRYQRELVAHQDFVTMMTTILDEQDRIMRVLITRIQNATTV